LVEYVDDRPGGRPGPARTDDEDYRTPIRPPGGRRTRTGLAAYAADFDDRDPVFDPHADVLETGAAPRRAARPATGRAAVPGTEPDPSLALDLYRPPRTEGAPGVVRRDPDSRRTGDVGRRADVDDGRHRGTDARRIGPADFDGRDFGRAGPVREGRRRDELDGPPPGDDAAARRRQEPSARRTAPLRDTEPRDDGQRADDVLQGELLPPDPHRRGRWNDPRPRVERTPAPQDTPRVKRTPAPQDTPQVKRPPAPQDTPRVKRPPAPQDTPRVIGKAAPPATPRVIKKADPPAPPRVISTAPQVAPQAVRREPTNRHDLHLPLTRPDLTTGVRPEHAPVPREEHADRLERPAGERQPADRGPVAGPPVAPAPARARVEPTPINGYAGGPGTHSVGTPPPRPEPTRPLPRQATVPRVGEAPPGRPAPVPPAADRRTPAAIDPYAGHQQSTPAGLADQPASGSAGAIQLTPPAAGDRPSMQTLSDLPLLPIGRIATSGPDTAPKKYTDQDLGATWFSATTPAEPAALEAAPREPATQQPAAQQPSAQQPSAQQPGSPAPSAQQPGAQQPGAQQPGAEEPAAREQPATGPGLVIDLDLTGILNGTDAGERPVVVSPAPAGSAQAVPNPGSRTAADSAPDPGAGPTGRQPGTAASPRIPPQSTAAARAGTAGTEWAARDEANKLPLSAGAASAEVQVSVRPLRPLPAEALAAIRWRLDAGTLREVVDDRDALSELGVRLDEPLTEEADNVTRAGQLSVRAEVYRLLDKLGMAAAASRLALAHAESSGDLQAIVIAQAELAHVLRLRGDFAEADRLFEQAASSEAPEQLRSMVHENAGRSCFDQGRHMEALDHFARSVRLGNPDDTDLVERIDVSLEAVYIHALRYGWGPYPRLRREIFGRSR
ncbi:MAG: hypothetical protein QOH97_5041, partial [Actinoplanes sp.]|nr:hypothetical protein [Actinoplanes sp.]